MKKYVWIVVAGAILLILSSMLTFGKTELNKYKLFFSGFDKIYLGQIIKGDADLKPLSIGVINNILSISTDGNLMAIVGTYLPSTTKRIRYSLVLTDLAFKKPIKLLERGLMLNAALAPDNASIAFVTSPHKRYPGGADFYDICVFDINKRSYNIVVHGKAARTSSVFWHPSGKQIAFTSIDGTVNIVNIEDGDIVALFKGDKPTWSPRGGQLAYYTNNKELYLHTIDSDESKKIYSRYFWQSSILGKIYWSPDERYISFNVASGIDGMSLKCIVIDVNSKKTFKIYDGSYWCGPWLSTRNSDKTPN